MRNLLLLSIIATLFACQPDVSKFEYQVECIECQVSYWNENGDFIGRVPVNGEWSTRFEAESPKIEIYAQSTLCPDLCDSVSINSDTVAVSVFMNGALLAKSEKCCKPYTLAGVILD